MTGIRFYDSNGKQVTGFVESDHLTTITTARTKIHKGKSFTVSFTNTCTNVGEMSVIAFNTPASGAIHLIFEAAVNAAAATVYMYKDTSIDVDEGTQKTPQNRNQQSATVPTVTSIETSPVAGKVTTFNESQAATANITTTTEVATSPLGAGTGPFSIGGNARGTQEWILEASTQYAFMVVSDTADDNIHWIEIDWYED